MHASDCHLIALLKSTKCFEWNYMINVIKCVSACLCFGPVPGPSCGLGLERQTHSAPHSQSNK